MLELDAEDVDVDVALGADGAQQDVGVRVVPRFFGRDAVLLDHAGDEGVVARDLVERAVADEVAAGVADVGAEGYGVVDDHARHERGAHVVAAGLGVALDGVVGLLEGLVEDVLDGVHVGARLDLDALAGDVDEGLDGEAAGDLAAVVAAHAVRDDEDLDAVGQAGPAPVVLVQHALEADVGHAGVQGGGAAGSAAVRLLLERAAELGGGGEHAAFGLEEELLPAALLEGGVATEDLAELHEGLARFFCGERGVGDGAHVRVEEDGLAALPDHEVGPVQPVEADAVEREHAEHADRALGEADHAVDGERRGLVEQQKLVVVGHDRADLRRVLLREGEHVARREHRGVADLFVEEREEGLEARALPSGRQEELARRERGAALGAALDGLRVVLVAAFPAPPRGAVGTMVVDEVEHPPLCQTDQPFDPVVVGEVHARLKARGAGTVAAGHARGVLTGGGSEGAGV